jgi:MFS family permease
MKASLLKSKVGDDDKIDDDGQDGGEVGIFGIPRGTIDLGLLCFVFATALSVTCSLSTAGPVAVEQFSGNDAQALWMYAAYIVGISFTALISGRVFERTGRFKGFMIGNTLYLIGTGFGCWGAVEESGPLIILAALFFGMGQGFANFLRFAAAEIAEVNATGTKREKAAIKSTALTLVLSGGILASFFGPTMTGFCEFWFPKHQYLGDFILMGILTLVNMFTLCLIRWPSKIEGTQLDRSLSTSSAGPRRSLYEVVTSRIFVFAVIFSAAPYGIMSLVMSSVGVSMTDNYDHQLVDVAYCFTAHYFFMYLPGFFSGKFIAAHGILVGCSLGIVLNMLAMIVMYFDTSVVGFIAGMGLVGMGWNFGFSAGSILLMRATRPEEGLTANVQAVHDFIVFFSSGIIVLGGGELYKSFGWANTTIFGMAMVGAYAAVCLWAKYLAVTRTQRQYSVMTPSVGEFGPIVSNDLQLADDVGELLDLDDDEEEEDTNNA